MFSATSTSSKNSHLKFVQEINANESNLFNRSFDDASKITRSGKLKQTKLCLSTAWNRIKAGQGKTVKLDADINKGKLGCLLNKSQKRESQLFQITKPRVKQQMNINVTDLKKNASNRFNNKANTVGNLSVKTGRNLLAILGRVEFCLEKHNIHKDIKAIWDIYGKLIKVTMGKQRYEHILLLRSIECGPILQAVYYDFANTLQSIKAGFNVRVVGRFIGNNRLHIYKIQQVMNLTATEGPFTRIQNATSFALLQNDKCERKL